MALSPRVRVLLGVLGSAVLLSAVFASPALGATPKIVGSASTVYPVQHHYVTLYAKVLNKKGRVVPGAKVTFTWKLAGHTYVSYAKTNKRGIAANKRNIGSATPWLAVKVGLAARVSGATAKGSAYFRPLPDINATHPVNVRIGIAGPLSQGATALGNGMLRGATLAIEEANASSTVTALGLHYVAVAADDKGDPAVAVAVAKSLASNPALLGVEGHLNSGCSIPAASIYRSAGVPMVTGASTNPYLTQIGYKNVFRNIYPDSQQGPAGAGYAFAPGRKAYVVDDSTPYGEGLASGFANQFEDLGGTIVGTAKTSYIDGDFTLLAASIKSAAPDVVYYGGIYNAGALLSSQMHAAGVTAAMLGGDGLYDPAYVDLGGTGVEGDLCTSPGFPASHLPNGTEFTAAYTARFPGAELTDYDAYAYDSTRVILSAIIAEAQARGAARVGIPGSKAETIARIAATDAQGVTGRIRFGANGDRLDPVFALYKVTGGVWTYQPIE